MKVFGWTGARHPRLELPGARSHDRQVRFIVAARSRTEAVRAAGENPRAAWVRDFVGETRNAGELEVALAKPGTVFAAALDAHPRVFVEVPEELLS
jgi:hypothetical protein